MWLLTLARQSILGKRGPKSFQIDLYDTVSKLATLLILTYKSRLTLKPRQKAASLHKTFCRKKIFILFPCLIPQIVIRCPLLLTQGLVGNLYDKTEQNVFNWARGKHILSVINLVRGITYRVFCLLFHGIRDTQIDGLVQERRNSRALTMELRLSCNNPPILW